MHGSGDRLVRILLLEQHVVVVQLEDQRHAARELPRAGLEKAERRRIGVAAGLDGELEVIARVVRGWVDGEAARRTVLDALVDRQDDQPSAASQGAGVQQPREVRQRARVVAAVPGQDLSHSIVHPLLPPRRPSIPRAATFTRRSAE